MGRVARELQIVYGTYVVGGDTNRQIVDYHHIEKSFEASVVEFGFMIREDDAPSFTAACALAEQAFRTPYQPLRVTLSGKRLIDLGRSNQGFDANPEITKPEDQLQTGRSRLYRVRIEFGMPANTGAEREVGLRSLEVGIEYTPSRRRAVTVSGEWTAVGSNNAQSQYEAKIDAFAASVLSGFAGTHELVEENVTQSTNIKTVQFERRYVEIIFEQGKKGTLDDPDIVDQHLIIRRNRVGPGDSPYEQNAPVRLQRIELSYSCNIDNTRTTDLKKKYQSIRKWLVDKARAITDAKTVALVDDTPRYDFDDNRIDVNMSLHAASGGFVLEYEESVADQLSDGVVLTPVWGGDRLAKYQYPGPATLRRTVDATALFNGTVSYRAAQFEAQKLARRTLGSRPSASPTTSDSGLKSAFLDRNVRVSHKTRGLDQYTLPVTEVSFTVVFEFYKSPGAGTGTPTPTPRLTERTPSV